MNWLLRLSPQATSVGSAGVSLRYLTAGHGPPSCCYTGTAREPRACGGRSSRDWQAARTVVAPDLPASAVRVFLPEASGHDERGEAHSPLIASLGITKAADCRARHRVDGRVRLRRAVSLGSREARADGCVSPRRRGWETIYNDPGIWHFRFNGPTPEALVKGRERTFFEHFWNDMAADKTHSIPEADRIAYAARIRAPGPDARGLGVLVLVSEGCVRLRRVCAHEAHHARVVAWRRKSQQRRAGRQARLIGTNVTVVTLPNTGHWLMEERPKETMDALVRFLDGNSATATAH